MKLEDIVKTWTPKMEPEFRGFRCGVCQQSLEKAYHYTLDSKEYLVPVHVCETCQKDTKIEGGLSADEAGEYKAFQCDRCHSEVTEAYHIWKKDGTKLTETHLCKVCGDQIL
jgi:hypothetical protein